MAGLWALQASEEAQSAEGRTRLVVKFASLERLAIQTRIEGTPPTVVIEFPEHRVVGSLPEHSAIQRGAIEGIRAFYVPSTASERVRWIRAMHIQLRDAYEATVESESGRIVVEVLHPSNIASDALEIALTRGTILQGRLAAAKHSERFRAMQQALNEAGSSSRRSEASALPFLAPRTTASIKTPDVPPSSLTPRSASSGALNHSFPTAQRLREPSKRQTAPVVGWAFGFGSLLAAVGLWYAVKRRHATSLEQHASQERPVGPQIMNHLIWKAFERQGYQLMHDVDVATPRGLLRIMTKEQAKAAVMYVANGAFFEKTIVEQFFRELQRARVEQGFLIAPGSFTVPAQRCAKEHGIVLIGREQLMELLSVGAMEESVVHQVQGVQAKLEEAKTTLDRYAEQLDELRGQRNEASWFLGEERAKSAQLEATIAQLTQQIVEWQAQAEQWQHEAQERRTQWEESEWYLGEAKRANQLLEDRLKAMDDTLKTTKEHARQSAAALEEAQRERDEANWYLGESRAAHERLAQQVLQLQQDVTSAQAACVDFQRRLVIEQEAARAFQAELHALRRFGERRKAPRKSSPDFAIQLQDPSGQLLFQGTPRDVSRSGFSISAEQLLQLPEFVHVRLTVPAHKTPMASTGCVVWQREDPVTHHFVSGCELMAMSPEDRAALEQTLSSLN